VAGGHGVYKEGREPHPTDARGQAAHYVDDEELVALESQAPVQRPQNSAQRDDKQEGEDGAQLQRGLRPDDSLNDEVRIGAEEQAAGDEEAAQHNRPPAAGGRGRLTLDGNGGTQGARLFVPTEGVSLGRPRGGASGGEAQRGREGVALDEDGRGYRT